MDKHFFKGLFTSIGIFVGVALIVVLISGGITALLDNNGLTRFSIILIWIVVPSTIVVIFVVGIIKYIKVRSKFWLGFTLGSAVLVGAAPFQAIGILFISGI